ncbi:hypothetical protein [Labrys monachus]|uniref:Uncharacterized membrane protein YuzA (DUF378 family) n=1 Tax=Labrys monachus TaxID=217067 RepID=A0ABU0FAS5_9HYPH|nr:hypothetical protein [Labrys monachus]MDQ0391721.1 uncharacterized membrane protein YuzA (DUF378 family) [Labrys monachus]
MPSPDKSINWTSLITIASAAVLIGTELLGAAWASGWALAGFFQLGPTFETILQAVFGLCAIYAIVVFLRQATRVEPIFKRG